MKYSFKRIFFDQNTKLQMGTEDEDKPEDKPEEGYNYTYIIVIIVVVIIILVIGYYYYTRRKKANYSPLASLQDENLSSEVEDEYYSDEYSDLE